MGSVIDYEVGLRLLLEQSISDKEQSKYAYLMPQSLIQYCLAISTFISTTFI